MLGSIISVPCNINKAQSILSHVFEDDATIGLQSKSPYTIGNIYPNSIIQNLKHYCSPTIG